MLRAWTAAAATCCFPSTPAVNALLAVVYISGPPNLVLALVPADVDAAALSVLAAFAAGALLGDVFLHLLPELFARGLLHDGRTRALGRLIAAGFLVLLAIDRSVRILAAGPVRARAAIATPKKRGQTRSAAETAHGRSSQALRSRRRKTATADRATDARIHTTAYLNLIADAAHNLTDGLAIAAAFYSSHRIGAATSLAVFAHELPHEISDYAILVRSGFSKRQALAAQFATAGGTLLGALIGISVHGAARDTAALTLLGSPLANAMSALTTGACLYVATIGILSDLLEPRSPRCSETAHSLAQLAALVFGLVLMDFA